MKSRPKPVSPLTSGSSRATGFHPLPPGWAEALIERNPRQRVILMSAIADELSRARAMMRGNVRIITKPVTLEKIRGEVTELLG